MTYTRETWFTQQLKAAEREAQKWPDWAREEAGLKPLPISETTHTVNNTDPAPNKTEVQELADYNK